MQAERERQQVATISAHNDPAIGELVADAIEKVGAEGAVTVEEAKGTETAMEVVEGLQFDRGYLSPYFVTDPEKMEAVLEDALVLIYEGKISNVKDSCRCSSRWPSAARRSSSSPRRSKARRSPRSSSTAARRVRRRRRQGAGLRRSPQGDAQDIAIVTGGQLIAQELGIRLENVTLEHLGRAARVVVDREHTTIVGGKGEKARH